MHQPDWLISKAELPSLDSEVLLGALQQYLRSYQDTDSKWEAEQDQTSEEDEEDKMSGISTHTAKSPQGPTAAQMEVPAEPQRNTAAQKGTPYYSFGSWLGEIHTGMKLAREALQSQLRMLNSMADGLEPSDADINSLTQLAAGALGTINGLASGSDLMLDRYKECRATAVPQAAAEAHPESHAVGDPPRRRPPAPHSGNLLSYKDAATAASTTSPTPRIDDNRSEMLRRRREVFGELKKANRADERAFRLLQPSNRLPMALGLVGKAFLEGIKWKSSEDSPIEDIRKDPRGNFYVQIKRAQFRLVTKRVQENRNEEQSIDLPSLGPTLIKDPRKCERAGLTPAALTRIHQDWTLDHAAEEIWTSNKDRWQLGPNATRQDHIILERRLARRDPNSEDPSVRIPSQTIKIWLSKELAARIERDGCAVRFDYQIHEVRRFEDTTGRQQATRSL